MRYNPMISLTSHIANRAPCAKKRAVRVPRIRARRRAPCVMRIRHEGAQKKDPLPEEAGRAEAPLKVEDLGLQSAEEEEEVRALDLDAGRVDPVEARDKAGRKFAEEEDDAVDLPPGNDVAA